MSPNRKDAGTERYEVGKLGDFRPWGTKDGISVAIKASPTPACIEYTASWAQRRREVAAAYEASDQGIAVRATYAASDHGIAVRASWAEAEAENLAVRAAAGDPALARRPTQLQGHIIPAGRTCCFEGCNEKAGAGQCPACPGHCFDNQHIEWAGCSQTSTGLCKVKTHRPGYILCRVDR